MIWGETAALVSAGLWASASVLFTAEGKRTRPLVMNLVKSFGASAVFAVVMVATSDGAFGRVAGPGWPAPGVVLGLALSGVVGIGIGDTLYFLALDRIGVRRTMILGLLAPVFAAAGAAIAGQDLPGASGGAGIAVTLLGLFFFLRAAPLSDRSSARARAAVLLGLGAAACQAVGIVLTKSFIGEVGLLPASILRLCAGAGVLLLLEVVRGRGSVVLRETAAGFTRARLLLAAFVGTVLAFYLLQLAILLGSPPITAALTATSPILAAPLAARFLGEKLPWMAALGTLVAVAGVVLMMLD